MAALRSRVRDALAQRPLSFREFKRIMGTHESPDSAKSSSGVDLTPEHSGDGREHAAEPIHEGLLLEVAQMLRRNFSLTSP